MLETTTPVSALANIGPKYKKLLENLQIYTIGDLIYHFPFRYDDFSEVKNIKDLLDGETATIQARILTIDNIFTKYGKRLTKAKVEDKSGTIDIMWFNSHYLKKLLQPTTQYNFSGKISKFSSKLSMIAPSYEEVGQDNLSTGRLVPIYPETSGVSSKWLRARISDILANKLLISEFLPTEILTHENFPPITPALNDFHFPSSLGKANTAKKRFQFEELFLELLNVESRKSAWNMQQNSVKINSLIHDQKLTNLIKSLPFKLSESQQSALTEIIADLKSDHPANRLLEGDVGTGKTIVALICAYLTYLNNLTTLYMAPTEILAKQHFETFKKYLEPFGVNVNLLTANTKIINSEDTPHISIGTHSLLFAKQHKDVGLVIIDEQHRFGVEQRSKLVQMNAAGFTPHLLTMTATPIPRSLALTLYGDLEISTLKGIPEKKKQITTRVVPEKAREQAFMWIKQQKEQTFIVCPFIEESVVENFENVKAATAEYTKLSEGIFKGLKVGLLHGRMKPAEKQEVVKQFETKEIQILISTPVIEVGIDIPEASIMVIESAERYGLASLHQLRGRVGRGGQIGHCLIFMSDNNRTAYKRLKYLEEINDGLQLAEIDLDLRGHGDIYGTMQHGFKTFKLARLSDIELLTKAKKYAAEYYPRLAKLPMLQAKIVEKSGQYVGNN